MKKKAKKKAKPKKQKTVICPCENLAAGDKIDAIKRAIVSPTQATLDALALSANTYDLLMPSAIASLAGKHRADHQAPREAFVRGMLDRLKLALLIIDYADNTHDQGRFDFSVNTKSGRVSVVDVKGGEGNSITICTRPHHCHEFGIWCHFTGSLAIPPGQQARAVASRMLKVMLNREEDTKRYDFLIIWDGFCGSAIRPCPFAGERVFPCVMLFPQVQPTKVTTHPPLHTLATVELPNLLFDALGLTVAERMEHVWQCEIVLFQEGPVWYRRVKFIRLKDGSVQETPRAKCNPDDAPKPTP